MIDIYDLSDLKRAKIIKMRLLSDFKFFCQYMHKHVFGIDFLWTEIHDKMAAGLMGVFRGRIKRLAIEAPPQTGKSKMAVPLFCAFCYAHNPVCAFMNLSRSDDLIKGNSSDLKAILKSHAYSTLFGYSIASGKDEIKRWQTTEGGSYNAVSVDGQVAGKPSGRITASKLFQGALIADDLVKPKAAMYYFSEREKAFSALVDAQSRLGTSETPIIVIMQRTNSDDPIGRIRKGLLALQWHIISISALDENGESVWPVKWSTEYLQEVRIKNPQFFNAQYLQITEDDESSIFKREWWGNYRMLPPLDYIYIFCDTAQKKGETNDYTVFAAWGYSNRKIYLIDVLRQRLTAPELRRALWAFVDKHHCAYGGARVRKIFVEDAVSGTGLIQFIKEDGGMPVEGIQRSTDKVSRAHGACGYVEAGYVYLPERAPWLCDFIDEHAAFPNGDFDDQVDTTSDAVDNMLITVQFSKIVGSVI